MTVSLVDGLGGEELGQAGSQISSLWVTGSIVTDTTLKAVVVSGTTVVISPTISGTTSIRATNFITPGSITCGSAGDADGRFRSAMLGSPGNAGAIVQAGSFVTGAGSTAAVLFRTNFATAGGYVFWAFPQSGVTFTSNGSAHVYTSGTVNNGKNTSGVNVVGGAAIQYDYIAIGI